MYEGQEQVHVRYFFFASLLNCFEETCHLHPKIYVTYPEDGGSSPFEHVGSIASVYLVLQHRMPQFTFSLL